MSSDQWKALGKENLSPMSRALSQILRWTLLLIMILHPLNKSDLWAQERPALHRRTHGTRSAFPAGFAFAGNKFVAFLGDLYWFGPNDNKLNPFSSRLKVPFDDSDPIFEHPLAGSLPGFEHPIAASLGLGGFPCGGIYIGAGNYILHLTEDSAEIDVFVANLHADVRTLLFDTTGAFEYKLLVGTKGGDLYLVDRYGNVEPLASVGENIGGMDIVPPGSEFGPLDGQLIVAAEVSGRLRAVNSRGLITNIDIPDDRHLFSVEGVFMVPRNLGSSGKPEAEGYYSILWANMIYQSGIENLHALRGDVLITTLGGVVAKHWRLHWNSSIFELIEVERFEDRVQSELFVTPTLISLGEACSTSSNHQSR